MKRFTLILSLLVAMVTTAMAQVTSIEEGQLYRLKDNTRNKYLTIRSYGGTSSSGSFGTVPMLALDQTNADQQFYIESASDGGYYLKSKTGYYITHRSWNIDACNDGSKGRVNFVDADNNPVTDFSAFYIQNLDRGVNYYYKVEDIPSDKNTSHPYCNATEGDGLQNRVYFSLEKVELEKTVSALADFNPNKCYTITTANRGAWTVLSDLSELYTTSFGYGKETQTVDKTNTKQQFAVLSADGENYYLFNVAANKFVKKDRSLVAGVADAIVLHDLSSIGEGRVMIQFKDKADGYVNIGGNGDPAINDWGAASWQYDAGNAVLFTEVDDFDPSEALEMLSNSATIIYQFMYDGVLVAMQKEQVSKGAAYPAFDVPNVPLGIVPAQNVPEGTVTADATINIELAINNELIPFEYVAEGMPAKWYYARMHGNNNVTSYIEDDESGVIEWADKNFTADEIDSHLWGFVGHPITGFKMVNKGSENAIASTGSGNASMTEIASATTFQAVANSYGTKGAFCLKSSNGNYLNAQGTSVNHYDENDNGSSLFLTEYTDEEVTTVTVGAVGYATMYLSKPVFVPEAVEIYVVSSVEGELAQMTQVTGILPAGTGVILKNEGEFTFSLAPARISAIEGNLLAGTLETTEIEKEEGNSYYVLANKNGIGFYNAVLGEDATKFKNAANKAYLVVPTAQAEGVASYSFRFGEGTTGVDEITDNRVQSTVIYDLTGRRVENISAPGIYVVNGKKVLVK